MRLIDADALMLIFNDWWYSSFGQEETERSLTIKEAMKAIEDAPTIDRPQGEWTPITKGLPKEPGTVLITHLSPLSPSGREVVSAWYDDDGLFYDSGWGTMMYSDVLAWAYPPKPYMGE